MSQQPPGNYRGGYRGRGGLQANNRFPPRGGNSGPNPRSSSFAPPTGPSGRGHHGFHDAVSQRKEGSGLDQGSEPDKDVCDTEDSRSQGTAQKENGQSDKPFSTNMAPPRQPPTGPSGQSKFSFSFNKSTKPTPTAPKPEISQKFNALPLRRDAFGNNERSNDKGHGSARDGGREKNNDRIHERSHGRHHERTHDRDLARGNDGGHDGGDGRNYGRNYERNFNRNHDRDFFRGPPPTAPASTRNRHDFNAPPDQAPRAPSKTSPSHYKGDEEDETTS